MGKWQGYGENAVVVVIAMATGWTAHADDDDDDVDDGEEEMEEAAKIDAAMAGRRLRLVVLAIMFISSSPLRR
jgi:hypothetical protein